MTHNEVSKPTKPRGDQSPPILISERETSTAQSIRRIMRELKEISSEKNPYWAAWPVDLEHPYEWHFTVKGPTNTSFEGGVYHGRLVLPITYPMAPPTLYFLTTNGRFDVGKKVCLSASSYHPECWHPAWGIRSMLDALHAFFPTPAEGAVNGLDWPDDTRAALAKSSLSYKCPTCDLTNAQIAAEHFISESILPCQATENDQTTSRLDQTTSRLDQTTSRLEEIRLRRTAAVTRNSEFSAKDMGFPFWLPSWCIFVYWLLYFLGAQAFHLTTDRARKWYALTGSRNTIILISLIILGLWSLYVVSKYTHFIIKSSFFLFDVPIDRQFQSVTNPVDEKPLSIAESVEDFPIHPFIRQLVQALGGGQ